MALFARTGKGENASDKNIVVGSVHKLEKGHRERLWKHFGVNITSAVGSSNRTSSKSTRPQFGVVAGGDLTSSAFCEHYGLRNLDMKNQYKTFPANCAAGTSGGWRGDFFCGNMAIHEEDKVILPCYNNSETTKQVQISDHSIIEIVLKLPE